MRKSTADEITANIGRRQHGLFSNLQGHAAGLSREAIAHRLEKGQLVRILPGVLGFCGVPDSWDRDLMAVLLWAGDCSAASHRAAARVFGFDGFSDVPIEISTTNNKNATHLSLTSGRSIVVHRVDEHLMSEVIFTDDEFPVTSVRKTVLDLAGKRHPRTESVLDAALRRKIIDVGELWLMLEQEWMRGRRGVAILRDLLIPRTAGRAPTDSDLELELRHLIDDAKLPAPVHQHPLTIPMGPIRMDLSYPNRLLDLETDSLLWHLDRATFERDRRRDNELRALGWTVLRFTWAMIHYEPDSVISAIRKHLEPDPVVTVQKSAL